MNECGYEVLRSALASAQMEDFAVTGETETDYERLLRGKISVEDVVKEIMSRPTKVV